MATLTSKGQITIPKPIRDALHLRTGDRLSFSLEKGGRVTIKPERKGSIMALAGCLKSDVKGKTLEDFDRAIENEAARLYLQTDVEPEDRV